MKNLRIFPNPIYRPLFPLMNSAPLFNEIHELITHLLRSTGQKNRLNLGDQAIYLEDLFGNIFNVLYKYNVENINEEKSNEEAVDLVDEKAKVVLQVTTRQSGFTKKKNDTVKGFLKSSEYTGFKRLYLLFLTENKVDKKNLTKGIVRLGCHYEGIDLIKLLSKIKAARVLVKKEVKELLKEELSKVEQLSNIEVIDIKLLKYKLDLDLQEFLNMKYFSNTRKVNMPTLLNRKVKRFNQEVKVSVKDLQDTEEEALKEQEVTVGELSSFILSDKPSFLFGEMGSGKSTLVAELLSIQNKNTDNIHVLIPANVIKGNITEHTDSVIDLLAVFLSKQLLVSASYSSINQLLKDRVVVLAFDGLDELSLNETRTLVNHLIKLSENFSSLTVIATGRPIELQNAINRREWNCLSTIDLSLAEMSELLINESIAEGMSPVEAKIDTDKRIAYIKTRSDLLSLAVTPLVLTMIRDHLSELSDSLSLGDVLYKVMKEKLSWDSKDLKAHSTDFFNAYPSVFDREGIVAKLCKNIKDSVDKTITEESIHRLITLQVNDNSIQGKKLAHNIVEFLKSTFLQNIDDKYSFISQPLLDTGYGIALADDFMKIPLELGYLEINWRSISIAGAVIRARSEIAKYRDYFTSLLKLLMCKEANTTQAAVIVQELGDEDLAKKYIELLIPLSFRPLRVWRSEDSNLESANTFSPVALANTIALAGEEGFDWFFNEYLDPKKPLHIHETGISANILLFYLIKKDFILSEDQHSKVKSVIQYHVHFRTFSCTNVMAVIALVMPTEFEEELVSSLLLHMVKKEATMDRAKYLIEGLVSQYGPMSILNAVEVYADEKGGYHHPEVIHLWYKYKRGIGLNEAILRATITAIVFGNPSLLELINEKIGQEQFIRYLKFQCLTDSDRADECAILLYEYFNVRDFYLVARPILLCSRWNHGNDHRRKNILNKILFDNNNPSAELITKMQIVGKDELPLLCYEYLIRCFIYLEEDLTVMFCNTIKFLPKYSLTRNPSLRDTIRTLLHQKPSYNKSLKNAALSLDWDVRRNAQHLAISCTPDDCSVELIAMIRGFIDPLPRDDEWLSFLCKLDFRKDVLTRLYNELSTFNPYAKTAALIILYKSHFKMNSGELSEMVKLLMGKGHHFDRDEKVSQQNRIMSAPAFLPKLLEVLRFDKMHEYENISSILYQYHRDEIPDDDLLYVTVLQIEKYSFYLFDFANEYMELLQQDSFLERLRSAISKAKKVLGIERSATEIFINALKGQKENWISLYELLFFDRGRIVEEWQFRLYSWLAFLRKSRPHLTKIAGEAALEMSHSPANVEGYQNRTLNGVLLLLADEFYSVEKQFIEEVMVNYQLHHDLYPALACRLGEIPDCHMGSQGKSYLYIFKGNVSKTIQPHDANEIAAYLSTSISLPEDLPSFLRSLIIYNSIDESFLSRTDKKPLESLVTVIMRFLNTGEVEFKELIEIFNQIREYIGFKDFENMTHLLKEIRLTRPEGKENYALELQNRISINKRHFLGELVIFYVELLELKVPLSFELFETLFQEIITRRYLFDMNLLYLISEHISENISVAVHDQIADLLYIHLTSIIEETDEFHRSDFYSIQWLFSIVYLYIKKEKEHKVTLSFLMGMQSVFIQNSKNRYNAGRGYNGEFKGRELLNHSAVLFDKLPDETIQEMLQHGLSLDIPEVRAVCRFFCTFHKTKSIKM